MAAEINHKENTAAYHKIIISPFIGHKSKLGETEQKLKAESPLEILGENSLSCLF